MAVIQIQRDVNPIQRPFTVPANCQPTDSVGDCVYVTSDVVNGVVQVSRADITNIAKMPSIGVISSKTSDIDCVVLFYGAMVLSGLLPGRPYFVGADSKAAPSRPSGAALIQVVGVALDATRLLFNPSPNMTRSSRART